MQQRTRGIPLNVSLISRRLRWTWRVGDGRWFLEEKAFSNVPWRSSGDDCGQQLSSPCRFSRQVRGFVFKIVRGLKNFHLAGREELSTHLRHILFKSLFCQSVTWLLHWWVFVFILFYGLLPVLARVCRGARGREQAQELPCAVGSVLGGWLQHPASHWTCPSRFKDRAGQRLHASGRKWFFRNELLKGWWRAASVWSLSFGAC